MSPWFTAAFAMLATVASSWAMARRSRALVQATLAVTFSIGWMLLDTAYIDVSDGVYASELGREIGGGNSAGALALFYVAFVAALLVVFGRGRIGVLRRLWSDQQSSGVPGIYVVATVFLMLCTVGVCAEILRGPIPGLSGIDRGSFAIEQAGPAVRLLYKYETYVFLLAGVLYLEASRGRHEVWRVGVFWCVVALVLGYVMLGHKFSGIAFNLMLFVVPTSLQHLVPGDGSTRRGIRGALVVLALSVLFFVTVRRYIVTESPNPLAASAYLEQRLLIQQGQMWVATYERVVHAPERDRAAAFDAVLAEPTGPAAGNTSLTYLMQVELGLAAYPLIENGYLYTGASPTILLDLFGLPLGLGVMFLASLVYAWLLYLVLRIVLQRDLLVAGLSFLVFGLVHNVIIGGHVSALTTRNFGLKCLAMAVAIVVADEWRRLRSARVSGDRSWGR